MATTVGTTEKVELADGTEITIRPLVITRLKEAMAYMSDSGIDDDGPTSGIDYIFGIAKICLKGVVDDDVNLEDVLDMPTAKRIIYVGTNVDFDDENLLVAQAAMAAQNGKTST